MNYLDLDSFRSRYSDITVTAVPTQKSNCNQPTKDNSDAVEQKSFETPEELAPHVEIIPVGPSSAAARQQLHNKQQQQQVQMQLQQKVAQDAVAYAIEYKQVLAKLEYTKYVQAQLLLSMSTGMGASTTESHKVVNIKDAYANLLSVIAEMHSNLAPTTIGLRAPKERLLRDIAQARVLVRECSLLLMRDQQQQQYEE
ncbi:uncharacterized protein LOC117781115 [Drosophila innubila]|uniref:uncharacterized protein LOC117781115 n=1 Tax=Drosophila innubila TaxID=198719 RepID=UPI00148E1078|nr:uncharacterized protein LOC117781115 [Drosophila innubila]